MRKLSFRLSGQAHTGHLGSQLLTRAALYCSIGMRHCLVTRDITPKGFNHQVAHLLWGRELGESESHFVLKTYILQHVYMHHYNPSCRQELQALQFSSFQLLSCVWLFVTASLGNSTNASLWQHRQGSWGLAMTLISVFPDYKKNSMINKHTHMCPFVLTYMTCIYMDLPHRKEKRWQSSGLGQKREAE